MDTPSHYLSLIGVDLTSDEITSLRLTLGAHLLPYLHDCMNEAKAEGNRKLATLVRDEITSFESILRKVKAAEAASYGVRGVTLLGEAEQPSRG